MQGAAELHRCFGQVESDSYALGRLCAGCLITASSESPPSASSLAYGLKVLMDSEVSLS